MKRTLLAIAMIFLLGSLIALESAPSETVGYVKYSCLSNENGNYNLMAIPMNAGYTLASELGADYPELTSIRYWDSTAQVWVASDNLGFMWFPDNPIVPNEVYYVTLSTNTDIYIAGKLNADPSYDLVTNENGNYNTLMLPLDSPFTLSSQLGDDIGVCTSIRYWDDVTQVWVASDNLGFMWFPDNAVNTAGAYYVTVSANTTWPTTEQALSNPAKDVPTKAVRAKRNPVSNELKPNRRRK